MMGHRRSYRDLWREYKEEAHPPTKSYATLARWARRFKWRIRLSTFIDQQQERELAEWESRRLQMCEDEWDTAQQLLDRAAQMLKFPLAEVKRVEKTHPDGTPIITTIIKPARWQQRDVVAFVRAASELARLATGSETARIAIENPHTATIKLIQLGVLSHEQLARDFNETFANEMMLEAGVDVKVKDVEVKDG